MQRRYTRHKTGKGCRIFAASEKSILTNFLQRQGVGDKLNYVNPLTHMSDQDRIYPHNINSISTRWVIRTKKIINLGIISWSNTKFSELTLQECMVDSKENNKFDLGVKGWIRYQIPFFFGPLQTTASSLLFKRKPMDMTASLWSLSV